MDFSPEFPSAPQPDGARALPREAFQEIILTLRSALPPPADDEPASEARQDRAAMAAVAALLPANTAEGRLAAQFVAADAWALDCLRLAREKRREPGIANKCKAQAMSLMREAKSSLRLLLRLQAARAKIEANEAAANRAAWAEHSALGMMEQALPATPADRNEAMPLGPPATVGHAAIAAFGAVSDDETKSHPTRHETAPRSRQPAVQAALRRG